MEKRISDKINALNSSAVSQEEFMKKLAELDENGPLTQDLLDQVNGGIDRLKTPGGLIGTPVLGLWTPPTSDTFTV